MKRQCPDPGWPSTQEFLEAFRQKAERLRIPLAGSFELTHRCNLDCVHCYLGPRAGRLAQRSRELGTARVRSLIDEMTEAGCMNLLLTGGEPLLREDFAEIYRHAKGNGLLVTLFTNGTAITGEIADLLGELPPVEVEVSVYGATARVCESVTRVPGSHEKCLSGIRALRERGVRVNLKTILMTLNRHEFHAIEELARGLGARFRFDAAISPGIDGDLAPLELRVPAAEAVAREMSDGSKVRKWREFYGAVKDRTLGEALYGCGAGLTMFHLDPYGGLHPCMMALDAGCDTAGGFKPAWESRILRIGERTSGPDFPCRGCVKIHLCGYCPGAFKLEKGSEELPSEYFCQMANLRYQHLHDHAVRGD